MFIIHDRERTHARVSRALDTALLQTFWRESCNECVSVASFSPLLIFFEVIQRFHANGNFIFVADKKPNCL